MIRRIAAIVGVLLASGAIAAVAIAIWPERAGNGDLELDRANRGRLGGRPRQRRSVTGPRRGSPTG